MSAGEIQLDMQLRAMKLHGWEREFRFHPGRRWRFDFAHPESKIAVEVEGGAWTKGRHNRPAGFIADMEKYNQAALMGWIVLRYTPQQVSSGEAVNQIEGALLAFYRGK